MKAAEGKEQAGPASEESEIRAIIDDWSDGLRNKDADRCLAYAADDILEFQLAPPLQYQGKETLRKNLEEWFAGFDGPIGIEITELKIWAGGEAALAHSINHITGRKNNGEQNDVWVRVTIGFHKQNGKWLVNHEHVSVPFYMDGSFRAAVDLKP